MSTGHIDDVGGAKRESWPQISKADNRIIDHPPARIYYPEYANIRVAIERPPVSRLFRNPQVEPAARHGMRSAFVALPG